MRYVASEGPNIVLEFSDQEVRTLLDIVNEFSSGPYGLSDEQWNEVMLHPREFEKSILDGLAGAIDKHDARP